jgi:hypothetical protein
MYSAPDLINKPNVNPSPDLTNSFLQVHRPRPMQATEYIGVLPGRPETARDPLTPQDIESAPTPTGVRTLRRVSRLPAAAVPEMQYHPVRGGTLGTELPRFTLEHAFATELLARQLEAAAAEDDEAVSRFVPLLFSGSFTKRL